MKLLYTTNYRTELFVESFRAIAEGNDPYKDVRADLNKIVLRIVRRIYERCRSVEDWLRLMAGANIVDVSTPWYNFSPNTLLTELERASSAITVPREVVKLVEGARSIAILLDNAGEAVIDIAFAIYASQGGRRVYLVSRSEPYEVDVIAEEVDELVKAIASEVSANHCVKVLGTGNSYPAPAMPHVNPEVVEVLERVDVVVSKGIANAEAIMEYESLDPRHVVIVLRAKCPPIAKVFGVSLGSPVIRVGYPTIIDVR